MRVLITGGCGFVGRRFARRLLDEGHYVTVVDNLISGIDPKDWAFKASKHNNFFFHNTDIRDYMKQPRMFDLVIHCAAIVGGRLKIDGDPLAVATDLSIDAEFFNWVVRTKNKPKIIYFSSSAVYPLNCQDKTNHVPLFESMLDFDEDTIAMPDQTYGWSKLSGEYLAQFAVKNYDADVVIYRPFGGYGEDQSMDYPFPSIIRRIVTGENPVTVWGSGDQQRDFIHIEDIVDAVLATMNVLKPGEALNLGTGFGLTFRELARIASGVLNIPIDIINDASKPEGVFARVADVTKLSKLWIHPDAMPRLKEGIRGVANHLTATKVPL